MKLDVDSLIQAALVRMHHAALVQMDRVQRREVPIQSAAAELGLMPEELKAFAEWKPSPPRDEDGR
jgi:hypothetical protein